MTDNKWHFEFYEADSPGWMLRIDSEADAVRYMACCDLLDKDKKQFKRLESDPKLNSSYTMVSHTEFGGFAQRIKEATGFDTDGAYDAMKILQAASMLKVLRHGETLLVNRQGGFMVRREGKKPKASVWRTDLVFPRYYSHDIRVKRFDDGCHYYAYIGDMQVKDGNILKWNTYEEAYKQAEKYAADKIRQRKQEQQ